MLLNLHMYMFDALHFHWAQVISFYSWLLLPNPILITIQKYEVTLQNFDLFLRMINISYNFIRIKYYLDDRSSR